MANLPSRRPDLRADLPAVDIPLMQPPIEDDDEKADGGIGVSHTMRPLVVHIDRPEDTPEGTLFELFWGPGSPVAYNIIRAGDEQLKRIPFTVPPDSIRESWADPVYVQVIRDQGPESRTTPLRLRVNLQYPGGQDNNPAPGNQNLVFELPEDVRLGGVDAQRAKDGVEVVVRYWQNMSAYDLLILVWGSVKVERLILPDQVGKDIVCTFDEDAIKEAGDSDLLPVAFQVRGATGNYPDPWALWSPIALVSVYLETDRLDAPWVQVPETEREIDLEELGSQPVQIGLTVSNADARRYSHIFLYWNGKNAQGGSVSHFEDRELAGAKGYFFTIDNDLVRAVAQGSATVYYELTGAEGVDDRRSHNRYLTVIGEVLEWPAPTVDQAQGGALDPDLPLITIRFPAQAGWNAADRLQVTVQSADSGGTVDYIAGRTVGQVPPDGEMTFDVTQTELKRFDGRLVEVFYSVSRGSEKPQESLRQVYLVGEPVRDMPAPEVENAPGGQLDPDDATDGAKVTAPFAETQAGDKLTLHWYSLVSAPPIGVQIETEGEVASFVVPYAYIEPNLDEWVSVFYSLERNGQPNRYSIVTDLLIGRGLGEPPVPDLLKASITGPATATLNPLDAQQGSELVVRYTGMLDSDSIQPVMIGTAGMGSPVIAAKPGSTAQQRVSFQVPETAIAANIGNANKTFTVRYDVTRAGEVSRSQTLTVTVTPIPRAKLEETDILIKEANPSTRVLDLSSGTANRTAKIGTWPFITSGSPVYLELQSFTASGAAHNLKIWNGGSAEVNPTWVNQKWWEHGIDYPAYLSKIGDGKKLTMHFKAALVPGKAEADTINFPVMEYTVKSKPPFAELTTFDNYNWNSWVRRTTGEIKLAQGNYYLEVKVGPAASNPVAPGYYKNIVGIPSSSRSWFEFSYKASRLNLEVELRLNNNWIERIPLQAGGWATYRRNLGVLSSVLIEIKFYNQVSQAYETIEVDNLKLYVE